MSVLSRRLLNPPCMHSNTLTPDGRRRLEPAAGLHAEAHAKLVGVQQSQTRPFVLVESVMHTADARALDEATVSALKRRVYAPPGKTTRAGHFDAIERAPRGCIAAHAHSLCRRSLPAITVLRAVGTLVLWRRAVRRALPTSIFICPAFIYPAILHRRLSVPADDSPRPKSRTCKGLLGRAAWAIQVLAGRSIPPRPLRTPNPDLSNV
ncbi:hypothetical protein DFH06DRAFT_1472040 [Mycena polygramma]|nr:hypothetical protein DFH06DRAFT_1472040 [Mycena polygramma]